MTEQEEGPLFQLPRYLLEHVLYLIALHPGGSHVRLTSSWMRAAFDRCNPRLVLGSKGDKQHSGPPARLLDVVRSSPCVSSLTLSTGACVAFPEVMEAAGPGLLRRLERLSVRPSASAGGIHALASCGGLRRLVLSGCRSVEDLQPLASCARLQHLDLSYCMLVEDLQPLSACTALRHLDLSHCIRVVDLRPLAACAQLLHLDLSFCNRVADVSSLAACAELQLLKLLFTQVQDLQPLAALPRLKIQPAEI